MNSSKDKIASQEHDTDVHVMSKLLKKGFTFILVLILILATLNIFQLQKTRQQLNQLVATNIKKMALGSIMRDAIRLRTISIHKMLETEDYFERDVERAKLIDNAKRYREARDKLKLLGITKAEEKLNEKIVKQIRYGQPLMREASDSLFSNEPHSLSREKVKNAVEPQQVLFKLLNELNQLHENQSNQALADVNKNFLYTILLTFIVATIVIFLCITIARRLYLHVITTSNILTNQNKDLVEAYIKAEESTKIKSEFLAKMSHEIRTPINGVMGMLQLLQGTKLDAEQKDFTETALHSSHSLLKVINDVLDFSKIEAGKLDIEDIDFSLSEKINDVISLAARQAHEKNIEINYFIHPGINEHYLGDPNRFTQVLSNLVSNAIKFTDKGEIKVDVSMHEQTTHTSTLKFEVSDTGIGIPDETKDKLFTSFHQADNSTTRNYGGSGLGLAICKQLVTLMGGKIGIMDNPDGGSIFWFSILLGHTDKESRAISNADIFNNKNAFIISKHPIHHAVLSPLLSTAGLNITSLKSILELKPSDKIDMLIFDDSEISNPECEKILKQFNCKKIIYLRHTTSTNASCVQLADSHLYKPVNSHVLLQTLKELFKLEDTQTTSANEENNDKLDEDVSKNILIVDDNKINQKVAAHTLTKLGYKHDIANNGKEAVDKLKQAPFDLVLMDIQMPVMDGIDATKELRFMQKENIISMFPIIALSANAMKGDKEKYIEAGMDDYLSKPVSMDALSLMLDKWLL